MQIAKEVFWHITVQTRLTSYNYSFGKSRIKSKQMFEQIV